MQIWLFHDTMAKPELCDHFDPLGDIPAFADGAPPEVIKAALVAWWRGIAPKETDDDATLGLYLTTLFGKLQSGGVFTDAEIKRVLEAWWTELPFGGLASYVVERRSNTYIVIPSGFNPDRNTLTGKRLDKLRGWTPGERIS